MSNSLRPHGVQHTRLPCPTLCARVCSNSCPVSQWCHPTISASVVPFSSCLQSFPASGSFPVSQLFTSGGQSIGVSASTSVLPIHCWFPFKIDWFDLAVQGTLKSLLQHHSSKASILRCWAVFMVHLSHPYTTTGKTIALTMDLCRQVMSLLFNVLSRFVIAFLLRSKCLNFVAAVTVHGDFGAQENKISHYFHFFPHLFAMKWWDQMPWS